MNENSDHLQDLIDAYLNGSLSEADGATLNRMLDDSRAARDEFRSRIAFHDSLYEHFSDADDVLGFELPNAEAKNPRYPLAWIAAAAAALVLLTFLFVDRREPATFFGSFTTTNESIELRRYDFTGEQLIEVHLTSGVDIVIEAPASFEFRDATRLELYDGKLSANVPEGAEGFTVITPRGEVIDLGTRFGVSVSEDHVETHVFEGEVEVRQKGASKTVRLQQSESMDLVEKTTGTSDSSRFPMPAFVLAASLDNAGFEEDSDIVQGMPATHQTWGGDEHRLAEAYPAPSPGTQGPAIQPAEGRRMLQFIGTSPSPDDPRGRASELWQMIDLTPFSDEVNRGGVEAAFSAKFNRISGTARIDRKFGIALLAFQGSVKLADSHWDRKNEPLSEQLATSYTAMNSDDDPATWEPLACEFVIPPNADYLVALIYAAEDNVDDSVGEFEGHFVDACTLTLTTQPRASIPSANWIGPSGDWHDRRSWQENKRPDGARESIRIVDAEELRLGSRAELKQNLWLGYGNGHARMRILPGGVLERSGRGELVLGHNEGGAAEMIVEGKLLTRGRVFIGRNNAASRLIVDGGSWESSHGLVRMSQYGNRGPDTVSELIVRNNGTVTAERIELIHDRATLTVESAGIVDVERLQVGGEDGEARVVIGDGLLRVRELKFGRVKSVVELAVENAVIELLGEWDAADLRGMPGAEWSTDPGLQTESFTRNKETWTRVTRASSRN